MAVAVEVGVFGSKAVAGTVGVVTLAGDVDVEAVMSAFDVK